MTDEDAVPSHAHAGKIIQSEDRCYPSEFNPFGCRITVVLVEGNAAYIGQVGNKLSQREAEAFLGMNLEKEKYRL